MERDARSHRKRGRSEDGQNDQENNYTEGNRVRVPFGNISQQNNLQPHISNEIIPSDPASDQNPIQSNIINQSSSGEIFAPSITGCTFNGSVNMTQNMLSETDSLSVNRDEILQNIKNEMKSRMLKDCQRILEGSSQQSVSLNQIYTRLFIINDDSDPINREHEIWQIDSSYDLNTSAQKVLNYNDILQPPMDETRTVKIVLTKGIAGIGKTVTVQKFVLDWASEAANQGIDLVFLFPFRELNLLMDEQKSLFDLVCLFNPEFKKARNIFDWICDRKVLFILDGLDEYRNPLNFQNILLSDVSQEATLDVLLVNLFRGKLLPSAQLWVTCRPMAAGQLPSDIFKQGYITQIRGFTDEQKEEYFRNQSEDPQLIQAILSHIKSQKSLWILCHIPLFCSISSVVLKVILEGGKWDGRILSTLTEMYIHYLLIQTGLSHKKYRGVELSHLNALKTHKQLILKLAGLAYWQLKKQNAIFSEEHLRKFNISVEEASQYPGVITCVSENSFGYLKTTMFSFVHLSVQEFFAALFAFHEFLSGNLDSLNLIKKAKNGGRDLCNFLKGVINVALESDKGHLDLFNCFIFGISCNSSREILEGLLPPIKGCSSDSHEKVKKFIKSLRRKNLSAERCISLVRFLVELKDRSFLQDMKEFEREKNTQAHTPHQCSLLAFQFLMSNTDQDEFDLRKYDIPLDGFKRLSPAIKCFRRAVLKGSHITEEHCAILTPYLMSPHSHLIHLDLSHNGLGLSALKQLSKAFLDPNCQIQTLNLSFNNLQTSDMKVLKDVLSGPNTNLRVLDLSDNDLYDTGAEILSAGLQNSNCHLKILRLLGCQIKETGFNRLVSSMKVNSSYLRELDLRYNNLGVITEGLHGLKDELPSLRILTGGFCRDEPGLNKYAVNLTFDPQTANKYLYLSEDSTVATRGKEEQDIPNHDKRFDTCNQVLCREPLSERCFFVVDVTGTDVYVGVACEGMERKGGDRRASLGYNEMSWSLRCSQNECVAHHSKYTVSLYTEPIKKLGVFVEREAGSVSFYKLSPQKSILYTFDTKFSENQNLYAALRMQEPNSAVVLSR